MTTPSTGELQAILDQGRWSRAAAILRRLDPAVAADAFLSISFEQQKILFRELPVDFAAKLAAALPYFDLFVLLRTLPAGQMASVVEKMNPQERLNFLDQLPEESWRQIVQELYGEAGVPEETPEARRVAARVEPIVEARQIEKKFSRPDGGEVQVIAPTSLSIEPGVIVALLGPSGSGKSTLLRMLTGLAAPSAGEVLWHGKPIRSEPANVSIVFQSFALFPWLTVIENVEAPLKAKGVAPIPRRKRALKILDTVGLDGFEAAYPKELSGGMKQRVGFARALVVEPEVLFLDEPFSALDVLTADNLRHELLELWQQKKIPTRAILMVTHNIAEAVDLADRLLIFGANPGRIRVELAGQPRREKDRAEASRA